MNNKRWFAALLASGALMLSGCGGGGGGGGGAATSVSGVAATGAAIVGGSVTAKCADSNTYTAAVTTSSSGSYSISGIPAAAFPCALEVSYGSPAQTLHSYATGNGRVNVTPLTDLALALATSADPATWFTGFTGTPVADLDAAIAELLGALNTQDYAAPNTTSSPFTTVFSANHTGWDLVLDQLQQGLSNSGSDYATLLNTVVTGGDAGAALPTAPASRSIAGTISGATAPVHWELWITIGSNSSKFAEGNSGDGSVTFSSTVPEGSVFQMAPPTSASQTCTIANGSGTVSGDITNVAITCVDNTSSLPDPTGTGAALAGADGITGTLNGVTYTHTATVNATPSISPANPVGNVAAMTDGNNHWTMYSIPAAVGTYDCKRAESETVIQLTVDGTPHGTHATGGNCRIKVTNITASSIEGRFSALLIKPGSPEGTVVDGYFRKSASGGGSATAHTGLAGTYNLTYQLIAPGGPFTHGQSVSASISGNILTVGTTVMTSPTSVSGAADAIAWTDTASGITYRVFNNTTGVFSEINLFNGSTFLGQLTEATGLVDPVAAFGSLAGGYTPTVTNFDDIFSLLGGTTVNVDVSAAGVVTLHLPTTPARDLTFDPADSSLTFQESADNAGHFYELNGSPYRLRVFLDADNEAVYWEVKQSNDYLELTAPMPAAATAFLDAIKALGTQTLTIVDDTEGATECSTQDLTVTGNSPNYSTTWAGGPLSYNIKMSIHEAGTGFTSLVLSWGPFYRLTLKDSGVVEVEKLNKWPLNTAYTVPLVVTQRATTDATEIASVCP